MSFAKRKLLDSIYEEDAKRAHKATLEGKEEILLTASNLGVDSASSLAVHPVVGQTFAETFSHLKQSEHYKEPEKTARKNINSILVNSRQRGNQLLKFIKNVPWEYGKIVPDYQIGNTGCALFLSLRYHSLNPNYIHDRLKELGSRFDLRVLLVYVDLPDSRFLIRQLGKISVLAEVTLILAWTYEEAARYLETYKAYENKPPTVIQERVEKDYASRMQDFLTRIKSINKTDVVTLLTTFGNLERLSTASQEEIALCTGIGPLKAERIKKTFLDPFRNKHSN